MWNEHPTSVIIRQTKACQKRQPWQEKNYVQAGEPVHATILTKHIKPSQNAPHLGHWSDMVLPNKEGKNVSFVTSPTTNQETKVPKHCTVHVTVLKLSVRVICLCHSARTLKNQPFPGGNQTPKSCFTKILLVEMYHWNKGAQISPLKMCIVSVQNMLNVTSICSQVD